MIKKVATSFLLLAGLILISHTVVAQSTSSISTNTSSYRPGQEITVTWSGLPATQGDWVALATSSAAENEFVAWVYTNAQANGTHTFTGLAAGTYEARVYHNWPSGGFTVQARSPFAVSLTGSIATNKKVYVTNEPIAVAWSNFPGKPGDWVALAKEDAPGDQFVAYAWTNSQVSDTHTFAALAPGNYEARAFYNWSAGGYTIEASYQFSVVTPVSTVTTDKAAYNLGEKIVVTWSGLPGSSDWISIGLKDSPPDQFVAWSWTNNASQGSHTFNSLPVGQYEARVFHNWSAGGYVIHAKKSFIVHEIIPATPTPTPTPIVTPSPTPPVINPYPYDPTPTPINPYPYEPYDPSPQGLSAVLGVFLQPVAGEFITLKEGEELPVVAKIEATRGNKLECVDVLLNGQPLSEDDLKGLNVPSDIKIPCE